MVVSTLETAHFTTQDIDKIIENIVNKGSKYSLLKKKITQ